MSDPHVDYLIVGGGSAGSVLANRLSADASTRVLVLEASRPDSAWDPFMHMPALPRPVGNRLHDRKLESEPERYLNDRCIGHARGTVRGGSSSTSAMVLQRGNPLDYERWAADKGMESWDYAHCLPYFKRMETCLAGADEWRGGCGPLLLERGPARTPLLGAFFEAVQQAGYPLTDDLNGYRQEGFATFDRINRSGQWHSAAQAYLHPAMHRGNLRVETGARATRVLFSGRRAVGAEYRRRGRTWRVRAREVVLAGGAFGSPQLLQLSGVGNAAELESLGIDVVADLPGVGEHLQDHLEVQVRHGSRPPLPVSPGLRRRLRVGPGWLSARKGHGAANHLDAGGFVRGNDDVAYPNLMLHFQPVAIGYDGSGPTGGHGYQVHVGPVCSDARGTVKIRSRDPAEHPVLRFGYLSSRRDRSEWVEAVRVARHILSRPAFAAYDGEELSPGPAVRTDEQILDWVRNDAETALHPSSTARMGTDELSVLDPGSLRVHGVEGLRVVDASAMPYVTNGSTCAPVMMLAEKAADLILGNTRLPPCEVRYYRHGEGMPLHPQHHEHQSHEHQSHEHLNHEPATTGRNT